MANATNPSVPLAKDKPAELLDNQLDLNRVLGDGPKQSGGRRIEIGGLGGTIPELQSVATELRKQYLITYIVPAGERPDQKLSVSTKRREVAQIMTILRSRELGLENQARRAETAAEKPTAKKKTKKTKKAAE